MAKIDALETLGTIIGEGGGRDAIHIAVAPMACGNAKLYPGQRIGYVAEVGDEGKAYADGEGCGIVDPFLTGPVFPGQRFWMFLMPRSITSLRHVWSHPNFDEEEAADAPISAGDASEKWLRDFFQGYDEDPDGCFEVNMKRIRNGDFDHEYLTLIGVEEHGPMTSEFWDHCETYLGRKLSPRPAYFSCSC